MRRFNNKTRGFLNKTQNVLILVFVIILTLYPLYWIIQLSLKTHVEAFRFPPKFLFRPIVKNYGNLFASDNFPFKLANSFIISTLATLLSIAIGMPAAYVLSRLKLRFKNVILLFTLTSRMAPPMAFIIPYFMVYNQAGLIDTRIGLVLIYTAFSIGLVVWSIWTFFDEIPQEIDEAAKIDGASVYQTLFRVILPLSIAGLSATAILCFIMAWNDFLFALILTRHHAVTAPVAISKAMAFEEMDIGKLTAGSVTVSAPAIIFYLIMQKSLKRGLLAGGIKG